MTQIIEAPTPLRDLNTTVVFLAGGITGCPDWQSEMIAQLQDIPLVTLLNPRRANFPIHDPSAAREQIEWEFRHLRKSHLILFWFPAETLCPITLYELGFQLGRRWHTPGIPNEICIGAHPEYQRRLDVEIQAKLAGHTKPIARCITDLAMQVRHTLGGI